MNRLRVPRPRRPGALWVLAAVVVVSLAVRVAWLDQPCHRPCRAARDHALVFDESYYVPAARSIAGLAPVAGQDRYPGVPPGDDPNAEHPQLAKLLMAGGMELLGDGPWAWRWLSLVCGTLAILAMFGLARAAGACRSLATVAAALLAADNLMLVHGRIGTLDMPVLAAMLVAAALYLSGRVVWGGAVLGVGACLKLVAPYVVVVLALYELLSGGRGRAAVGRLARLVGAAVASGLALLALLDRLAPPYDPVSRRLVSGGVLGHLGHMLAYGAAQRSPHGPRGIASLPWGWPLDIGSIVYLNVDPKRPAPGLTGLHPPVHFLGVINPAVLLLGAPGLLWLAWRLWRRLPPRAPTAALALAWFLGTWLPFGVLSLVWQRTSYLYYMVVVMPGLCLAAAWAAVALRRRHPRLMALWWALLAAGAVVLYPFTPLP